MIRSAPVWTIWLMACGEPPPPSDVERYVAALETIATDPEAGLALCGELQSEDRRQDCTWAAVKRLRDDELVRAACSSLEQQDECWFVAAEATKDASYCHEAGAYVGDCLMHLYSWGLERWIDEGMTPAQAVPLAREQMKALQMPPTSQTWYETFAYVLVAPGADLGGCAEVEGKPKRECEAAAKAVSGDPRRAPPAVHRARKAWKKRLE